MESPVVLLQSVQLTRGINFHKSYLQDVTYIEIFVSYGGIQNLFCVGFISYNPSSLIRSELDFLSYAAINLIHNVVTATQGTATRYSVSGVVKLSYDFENHNVSINNYAAINDPALTKDYNDVALSIGWRPVMHKIIMYDSQHTQIHSILPAKKGKVLGLYDEIRGKFFSSGENVY